MNVHSHNTNIIIFIWNGLHIVNAIVFCKFFFLSSPINYRSTGHLDKCIWESDNISSVLSNLEQ